MTTDSKYEAPLEFRVRLVVETTIRAVSPEAAFELARWDAQSTGFMVVKRTVFDDLGPVLETTEGMENRTRASARKPL